MIHVPWLIVLVLTCTVVVFGFASAQIFLGVPEPIAKWTAFVICGAMALCLIPKVVRPLP